MHTKGLEMQECENIHKKKRCVIMKIKISGNNQLGLEMITTHKLQEQEFRN